VVSFDEWKEARQRINRDSQHVEEILSTVRKETRLRKLALKFKPFPLSPDAFKNWTGPYRRCVRSDRTTSTSSYQIRGQPCFPNAVMSNGGYSCCNVSFMCRKFSNGPYSRLQVKRISSCRFRISSKEAPLSQLRNSDAKITVPRQAA